MVRTIGERRKAFKKALIDAGLTKKAWAEQQGVTDRHLNAVLLGVRESNRLIAAVDQFVAQHTPAFAPAAHETARVA